MPDNVKLTGKPMEQRISDRLKSSGEGANPDQIVRKGEGPTRTITHLHHSATNETKSSKKGSRG
jgi:hypothetical protein